MIQRYPQDRILASLQHFSVVLFTDARQVGKSTLAQELIRSSWQAHYLTLDERTALDSGHRYPYGLVSSLPLPAVIDEVLRAPSGFPHTGRHIWKEIF